MYDSHFDMYDPSQVSPSSSVSFLVCAVCQVSQTRCCKHTRACSRCDDPCSFIISIFKLHGISDNLIHRPCDSTSITPRLHIPHTHTHPCTTCSGAPPVLSTTHVPLPKGILTYFAVASATVSFHYQTGNEDTHGVYWEGKTSTLLS